MIETHELPLALPPSFLKNQLRAVSRHTFCLFESPETSNSSALFLENLFAAQPFRVRCKIMALTILVWSYALIRTGKLLSWISTKRKNALVDSLISSQLGLFRLAGHGWRAYSLMAMFRTEESRAQYFKESSPVVVRPKTLAPQIKPCPPIGDYLVIGSGPAGSIAAARLAERGEEVLILEEGNQFSRADFQKNAFFPMNHFLRDFGLQTTTSGIPILQGRAVGGTSIVNGAIMERLPRDIYEQWRLTIPFSAIENEMDGIERELEVTAPLASQLSTLPVHGLLNQMGWEHRAMSRSAQDCQGSGRCFQGCPSGAKRTMDNTYLSSAIAKGAKLAPQHKVETILFRKDRADAVVVKTATGKRRIEARKGILLAAGAIHTPTLLWRSGVSHPAVGKGFQCHWSASVAAVLPFAVQDWEGPPQGIEVSQFAGRGIHLATQLLPLELKLARTHVTGNALHELLKQSEKISSWMLSVPSETEGSLFFRLGLTPRIVLTPTPKDFSRIQEGMEHLIQLFKKSGASQIFPGVEGPKGDWKNAKPFLGAGHLFGGARIGNDPENSVLTPEFSVRGKEGLYCVDASLFPSHIGVHPQLSIMAMASYASKQI